MDFDIVCPECGQPVEWLSIHFNNGSEISYPETVCPVCKTEIIKYARGSFRGFTESDMNELNSPE